MNEVISWLNAISWGQFTVFKYIVVAVVVIAMFDLTFGLITAFIASLFRGR